MNALIKRLTNRGVFIWSDLQDGSGFLPGTSDPATESVRSLLGLDRRGTDYFAVAMLSTLAGFPDLLSLLGDTPTSYNLARYRPEPVTVIGAVLQADRFGPPILLPPATTWPPPMITTLTWLDSQNATVAFDNQLAVVRVWAGASSLQVDWPAGCGIRGLLDLDTPWASGSQVQFIGPPCGYPHAVILESLRLKTEVLECLTLAGLATGWADAIFPEEKIAILGTAVALNTTLPA